MNHKPHEHTFDKDGDLSSCTKCGLIKKTMTGSKSKALKNKKEKYRKSYHQVSNEHVGKNDEKIRVGFYKDRKGNETFEPYNKKYDK